MSHIENKQIVKLKDGAFHKVTDFLAVEEPLEISINIFNAQPPVINKNISITMRTPSNDEELAVGFLFTEGIIHLPEHVENITQSENQITVSLKNDETIDLSKLERHFYTSSSCGVCGKSSIDAIKTVCKLATSNLEISVKKEVLHGLPEKLRQQQAVFDCTGGLHAAALFSANGELLYLKEDVGRHNALDKLIGTAFQENRLPLNNHMLLLSGRASFELIQKASMAGIQFIMAVGAPSSLAVSLAEEFNMTLIGFLNKERFNIYCGAERVSGVNN